MSGRLYAGRTALYWSYWSLGDFHLTKGNKIPPSPPARGAVIVSAEEWVPKTERKGTLAEFLLASPLRGADLELERQTDTPRDLPL